MAADDARRTFEANAEPDPDAASAYPPPGAAKPSPTLGPGQALFTAYPPRVEFKDYAAFEPVSVVVRLRNHDTVARRVRVVPPDSTWFSISPFLHSSKRASKVAPGIEVKFRITFTAADEHADYRCAITVITEREQFLVEVDALGRPAQLEFPDAIRFDGAVPAHHVTMQTQLLRNVGRNEVAWEMRLAPGSPFRAVPAQGVLAPDQHALVQVEVGAGAVTGDLQGQLDLVYDKGRQRKIVQLFATVHDVDISLDADQIDLPPACIHLCTMGNVRLFNDSDIPITYMWMRSDQDGDGDGMPPRDPNRDDAEAATATAVRSKSLLFDQDPHFSIEPITGELYPGGYIEFTISFRPSASDSYTSWAFCHVSGRSQRLPLRLSGKGIGPTALFSFDKLDIGDVYINAVYRYEAVLKNVGRIEARFSLVRSPPSTRFVCEPDQGQLGSGQSQSIAITFSSSSLGTFHEVLTWTLWGSVSPVTLTMSGNVIAPTFDCDVERLQFGTVAYGFTTSRTFTLRNTSEIPIRALLRCPQDGKFLQREIDIRPAVVAVLPQGQARIEVELCSETVQCYSLHMICIDIENVGMDLYRIPLDAICIVPEIEFATDTLDYSRCYLRYAYERVLEMRNPTDHPVRFEIVTDLITSRRGHGRLQFDPVHGTLLPHSTCPLKMTLFAETLGEIEIGVYIRTCGASTTPFQVLVRGVGIGAHLTPSRTALDFRSVPVLESVQQRVTLRNDTPIAAPYVAFAARRYSTFVVSPREGVVDPGQQVELTVSLTCNDNAVFRDQIHVLVEDGDPVQLTCRALGQGSTIRCPDADLASLDLGNQFTVQTVTRTFTLRNDGLRPQTLTWLYDGAAQPSADTVTRPNPLFRIQPDKVVVDAGHAVRFTVDGRSAAPRPVAESWTCLGQYAGDKKPQARVQARIRVTFVEPHVTFSLDAIHFEYRHQLQETVRSLSRTVTLRNVTPLTLDVTVGVRAPFTTDRTAITALGPGQAVPVEITLPLPLDEADQRAALLSDRIDTDLIVTHTSHPSRDRLPLSAQLWFPNLAWAGTTHVAFGTIVQNSVAVRDVIATNPTVLAADFAWSFVADDDDNNNNSSAEGFDIEPLFGRIEPGQSRTFRVTFFGRPNVVARRRACCAVRGGPDYVFTLQGEAAPVQYTLELGPSRTLDFGPVEYHAVHERAFHVTNPGRVGFEVRTVVPAEFARILALRPAHCHVRPGSSERIIVRFITRRPVPVHAQFHLSAAFFESETVHVTGRGTCALVSAAASGTSLPGAESDLRSALIRHLDQHDRGDGFGPVDVHLVRHALQSPVVDLGDLVRGTQRKLTLDVTNVGDLALSLDVDKLHQAPFRLDPPRVAALAPAQSARYTITYVGGAAPNGGRSKPEPLGEVRALVQAHLSGGVLGPPLTLQVRAFVTLPDLHLSADCVDFGPIPFGFLARRYVRVKNPTRVDCEWTLTVQGRAFTVSAKSGTLAPGAHQDLAVTLAGSSTASAREHSTTIQFSIGANPRTDCVVRVRGRDQPVRVRFDPSPLQFAAASVPLGAGDKAGPAAAPTVVTLDIVNDSDLDIELFNVNSDQRYLLDEEKLRTAGRFDSSGQMLVDPIRPGTNPIADLVAVPTAEGAPDDGPVARPWRQVVVLGSPPSDTLLDQIAADHHLIAINLDRVVDRYAQMPMDAKLVAAERRNRKRPADAVTEAAPSAVALALAVQDAMASGQAAYVTPELLQKLLLDYCQSRSDPGTGQHDAADGVLYDATRCKVIVGGPRAAYGAVAALMERAVPDPTRPVRVYVIGFGGVLDADAAATFRVDPGLDVTQRVRCSRQAVVYGGAAAAGVDGEVVEEPIGVRIGAALRDQLDQYEQAVVRARIPPPQLFQILRCPPVRSPMPPSPFKLADPSTTRWIVPARGKVQVQVAFAPDPGWAGSGPISGELVFELAHDRARRFTLPCTASVRAASATDTFSIAANEGTRTGTKPS